MKGETFQQQQSKEVFGITMTEVMLLFVFGFQMLITTMSSDLEAREGENKGLLGANIDLTEFRKNVQGILKRLGITLETLPDEWHRLERDQAPAGDPFEDLLQPVELSEDDDGIGRFLAQIKGIPLSPQQGSEEEPRTHPLPGAAALAAAEQKIDDQQKTIGGLAGKVAQLTGRVAQLKGEVKYLREQNKGGRDWSPCWIGADSEVQFIVSITMYEDDLVDFVAKPAWPVTRKVEAYRLGLIDILRKDRFSEATFKREFGAIFRKSIRDRCRHYVYVVDRTISKAAYKRGLWVVEGYFYKVLR